MDDRTLQRPVRIAAVAAFSFFALAGIVSAQSLAPPLTAPAPIVTAPIPAPVVPSSPAAAAPLAGSAVPALRPPAPDVLPYVEREYRRLRDARLPPSACNHLDNGRICAKLWVSDDWRTNAKSGPKSRKSERATMRRDPLRRAPVRIADDRSPRPIADRDLVPDQVLIEFDRGISDAQLRAVARRHRLTRIGIDDFALIGSRIGLFRIDDRRSPQAVVRAIAAGNGVRAAQVNFRYALQGEAKAATPDDAVQYARARLRLSQAHALVRGENVVVAVIDSGIDGDHPELAGSFAGAFDPRGGKEAPNQHGTGIAGAIVAHARLTGGAPAAKILAIRAFGSGKDKSQSSTSYLILKSLDIAAGDRARIVNMSFAGPRDPLIARGVAAAVARGIVMIAAVGNAGPTSPPLYPAALPGVIAVSATDSGENLFPASNRGPQIAVAAPGVELLLPAPGGKYEMMTGTSFSAALVSGIAALMIARDPALGPDDIRAILTRTARDLGPPGRDDLFGAGQADAFAAVSAVQDRSAPVAAPAAASQSSVATAQPAASPIETAMPGGAEQATAPEPAAATAGR
jgi:hypothetical protein